ncbi:hypothetical protein [Pedococcus sp. 5OH_020]|uniref:hypothetical protein n=1 Tax=Pedococcus sp. 5OH_020 TaxID=2989814 RepID=UPI0022E9E319|nr:hypothetical protein [Pedococcus sp. 5OH_020]
MVYASGTLYVAHVRGQALRAVPVADPSASRLFFHEQFGRIRDAAIAPNGDLWFITNNTDGRGTPRGRDDRIMRVHLAG